MRCLFIYNPVSGRGKIASKLEKIVRKLGEKYEIVDSYATTGSGDMTRAVRENAEKYDAIVFSGGDGSFNEAVQGLCEANSVPEFGYIPGGTVNDVARSLGIPNNIRGALKVILTGKNVLLDCMKINDRYAMYIVAAGAFTSATYTTPQAQKKLVGRVAYGIEGIRNNLKFDVFNVKIEGKDVVAESESVLVLFMNGKYVAGMGLNRHASMTDGKIEVAIVRQRPRPNFLHRVGAYFVLAKLFLLGYRVKERRIEKLEGSHFEVTAGEGVVWNFDGERGLSGKVVVDVLPGESEHDRPREKKRFLKSTAARKARPHCFLRYVFQKFVQKGARPRALFRILPQKRCAAENKNPGNAHTALRRQICVLVSQCAKEISCSAGTWTSSVRSERWWWRCRAPSECRTSWSGGANGGTP